MTDNIIDFPESFSYTEHDGRIGITSNVALVEFIASEYGKHKITVGQGYCYDDFDRRAISEFLWAAAFFVDSDQQYLKKGDYPALKK